MDGERFAAAREQILSENQRDNGIGTLGEKALHAVLKAYYEPSADSREVKIGRYVADIVGEDGIYEIQTGNFNRLRAKLKVFLEYCDVTIVYPVPAIKYLCWTNTQTGELTKRRKSPVRRGAEQIIPELYRIKPFLTHPRLHFRICLLEAEEIRLLDGWSQNKKRGCTRCDCIPLRLLREVRIDSVRDYTQFLPASLPEEFNSSVYARHADVSRNTAQSVLALLTFLGIVIRTGRNKQGYLYQTQPAAFPAALYDGKPT